MFPERQRRGSLHSISREKAVSREKAQNAQKKESFVLTETLTEWMTTVSTPSFSFCAFCAFSWPSIAVFRINICWAAQCHVPGIWHGLSALILFFDSLPGACVFTEGST